MPLSTTWMQLEIIKLTEVSKNERDKYGITCIWSLKYKSNELTYKTETESLA